MQQTHSSTSHQNFQGFGREPSDLYPSGGSTSSGLDTTFFLGTAHSRVVWHIPPSLREMVSRKRWPQLSQNNLLADLVNLGVEWSLQSIDPLQFSNHLHRMLDRLLCSTLSLRRVLPTIETTTRELQSHHRTDLRAQVNLEAVAIRTQIIASLSQDPARFFDDNSRDLPNTYWSDIFFRKLWNNSDIRSVLTSAADSGDDLKRWFQEEIRQFCRRPEFSRLMSASEAEQFLKITTSAAQEAGLFREERIAKACVLELTRCSAFSSYVRQEIHDVLANLFIRARTSLLYNHKETPQEPSLHPLSVNETSQQNTPTSAERVVEKKTFVDQFRDLFSSLKVFVSGSSAPTSTPVAVTQVTDRNQSAEAASTRRSIRYNDSEWRSDELSLQREPSTPLMLRLRNEAIAAVENLTERLLTSREFREQLQEAVIPVHGARFEAVVRKARGIARDHMGPYISNYSKAQLAADLQKGTLSEHSRGYLNDRIALSWYSNEHTRHMHWQSYPANFCGPLDALFNLISTAKPENHVKLYNQIERLVLDIPYRRHERSVYLTRLAQLLPMESERRAEFEREARESSKVREWARARLYPKSRESFIRQQITNRLIPYLLDSESTRMAVVENAIGMTCEKRITKSFVQSRFYHDSVDQAMQKVRPEIKEAFLSKNSLATRTLDFLDNLLGAVIEEELIKRALSLIQEHREIPIPEGAMSRVARGVFNDIFSNHVLADLDLLQGFLALSLDQQGQSFADGYIDEHYPDPLRVYLSLSPAEQQEEFRNRLRQNGLLKDDLSPPVGQPRPVQRRHSWLRHLPGLSRLPF